LPEIITTVHETKTNMDLVSQAARYAVEQSHITLFNIRTELDEYTKQRQNPPSDPTPSLYQTLRHQYYAPEELPDRELEHYVDAEHGGCAPLALGLVLGAENVPTGWFGEEVTGINLQTQLKDQAQAQGLSLTTVTSISQMLELLHQPESVGAIIPMITEHSQSGMGHVVSILASSDRQENGAPSHYFAADAEVLGSVLAHTDTGELPNPIQYRHIPHPEGATQVMGMTEDYLATAFRAFDQIVPAIQVLSHIQDEPDSLTTFLRTFT